VSGRGAGEGAFLVVKELAFEQVIGNGRAVGDHIGAIVARARVVDQSGGALFSGAGLPENEHGQGAVARAREEIAG